jgi:hypothetical protein
VAGHEDVNDAERLRVDPAMRTIDHRWWPGQGTNARFDQLDGPLRDRDLQHQREPQAPDGSCTGSGSTGSIAIAVSPSSSSTWTVPSTRPTAS